MQHARALTCLCAALLAGACSEPREDAARPSGPPARVHPEGWTDPAAKESFHGAALRAGGWDMSTCRSCHGPDYAGGIAASTCLTCHARTPEGCRVCHGGAAGSAPPQDTYNNTESSAPGVGAHQAHLVAGALSTALACADCHHMPQGFADPAHIDGDGRAEVVFGERARSGGLEPAYDYQALTCENTHCHSGGRFGLKAGIVWNQVGTGQAACGTCHALPPAPETGHPNVPQSLACSTCHSSVVDRDLNIIDPEKHLNGKADL